MPSISLETGAVALSATGARLQTHSFFAPEGGGHRARVRLAADAGDAADGDSEDSFKSCMKMRVSEIKAELELRKISTEGLFEKEELARLLSESRRAGRADPSLLDEFNKKNLEKAFEATPGAEATADAPDLSAAAAADGSLPGGMSPEVLQAATSNPELMQLLRNQKLQDLMREMMAGGDAAKDEV